ncbi:hypothetical protein KDL01_28630 [Actinospica durhamensis]|uniref:Tat pathway signal sequence domain protein n=1 Tax=Actinospica durhamensis TaxID=1508375 RepID=A0A941EU48_9ACTN|nr:hypothetical protein [Actinospica durhamensis]MBR7837278.1 hypothetical protein [Actinospica durhamensis]
MSKRRLAALGVVAVSASAVVLSTSPAFATSSDVLSYGAANTGGSNVLTTDTLSGSLATGTTNTFTFTSSGKTVTITCGAAALTAKATSNPTAPGTAGLTLSALTFTTCSITGISGVTVSSVSLNGSATATVTDGTTKALNITALDERVVLNNGLGTVNCDYGNTTSEAAIVGTILNPGSGGTITFTNQTVHLLSGLTVCGASGSTGTFNATFASIVDTTHSSALVYAN